MTRAIPKAIRAGVGLGLGPRLHAGSGDKTRKRINLDHVERFHLIVWKLVPPYLNLLYSSHETLLSKS